MTKGICSENANNLVDMEVGLYCEERHGKQTPEISLYIDPDCLPEGYRDQNGRGFFDFELKNILNSVVDRYSSILLESPTEIEEAECISSMLAEFSEKIIDSIRGKRETNKLCIKAAPELLELFYKKVYGVGEPRYPNGQAYRRNCCAAELSSSKFKQQCRRNKGFGIGLLFCSQHSNTRGAMDIAR